MSTTINFPPVVSREAWTAARKELLAEEKQFTHARDALSARRRQLPMVEVEQSYTFEGPEGKRGLLELFEGRRQLIVYHFMWLWDHGKPRERGCPSCTASADEVAPGLLEHLAARDTSLVYVSRAPLANIEAYKKERGWRFPFVSSHGSAFNFDFHVSFDRSIAPLEYNFRNEQELKDSGFPLDKFEEPFDLHGHSCFVRDGKRVFHTYSTYGRGCEQLGGSYYFLDMTVLGRQESWEEPKDRVQKTHDASPDFKE